MELIKKHEGKVRITYKVSVPIPFSGIYFGLTTSQKSKRGIEIEIDG